ncbi:ABC transporter permease [Planctomicrobium piriforme]|nr:ABC transporter permease [Planctomicrobium piriforme]
MLRDLRQMPAQVLAIALVIGCGLAVLMMAVGTHRFLKRTRDAYYEQYYFAQVFAGLKRAPRPIGDRLREIPGIAALDLRIVDEAVIDVPGLDEPVVGRLISVPVRGEPPLNRIHIAEGRQIDPLRPGEVLVSEAFATANQLALGSQVKAVINGRMQPLTIVGIALSPEYVFQIRPGTLLPDDKRFGIFWMSELELEAALNMEGAFNSVAISLMHDTPEQNVIDEVDRLLKPYGCTGAYGRDRQVSAKFLSEELKQLRAIAIVAPAIFFGVACFLLNVVLERVITTQREQIASLKAFGYSNRDVGIHYAKFVLVIAALGSFLGALGGEYLDRFMSHAYSQFYHFPVFKFETDWTLMIVGIAATMFTAVLATVRPVYKAVSLPPAEAMRPAPPANFGPTLAERLGLTRFLSTSAQMVLRELERRPIKSFMSTLGIASAVAVLVLGRFGVDGVAYLLNFQFSLAQRYDVQVTFVEPTSPGVQRELELLPGVLAAETFRSVAVRFRSGHRTRLSSITGLGDQRDLFRVINTRERPVHLPPRGLLLGEKLAEILDAKIGETLVVEVLERDDLTLEIPVSGIYNELSGANAYIHRDHLHELLQETNACSGAFLQVDSLQLPTLYKQLKETPRVAGLMVKDSLVESFQKTVAENQLRMQKINMIFACIIAFGVIFNTARISLAERSREFATLRVIGFTRWEVAKVLLGELGILTLLAIPLGYLIGLGFCAALAKAFESEHFRMPLVISLKTLGIAAGITLLAAAASGLSVQRQINQLDMIGALKSKE